MRVLTKFPNTLFVEYVDGGEGFSTLNSDLRNVLSMNTTRSFTQIRSAPVRLRRELQALGYLTPLEIEHAIVQTSGSETAVGNFLVNQGYSATETKRAINHAICHEIIGKSGSKLVLKEERRPLVRQYLLLDSLAVYGATIKPGTEVSAASIFDTWVWGVLRLKHRSTRECSNR